MVGAISLNLMRICISPTWVPLKCIYTASVHAWHVDVYRMPAHAGLGNKPAGQKPGQNTGPKCSTALPMTLRTSNFELEIPTFRLYRWSLSITIIPWSQLVEFPASTFRGTSHQQFHRSVRLRCVGSWEHVFRFVSIRTLPRAAIADYRPILHS